MSHASQLGHPFVERRLERGHVPNVGPAGHDAAPLLFDQFDRLVQVIGRGRPVLDGVEPVAEVDGDDVRSLRGQAHGVRTTLPARRTGNERHLAVETTHCSTPFGLPQSYVLAEYRT